MQSPADASGSDQSAEDARILRRGALLNLIGQGLRLALPLLSIAMIRLYGAQAFGVFVVAQNTLQLVFRLTSLGLDKAALWSIARQTGAERGSGLLAIYAWTLSVCTVAAVIIALFAAPALASWGGDRGATSALRWMAAALVPMAVMEVSIHAGMGTKNMAGRVFVRDLLVPLLQLGIALTLGALGHRTTGLSTAYVCAQVAGALGALFLVRPLLRVAVHERSLRIPDPVFRYALPIWLSELAASVLGRMDVYAITRFGGASAVGTYAAIAQVANSLRSIRQSFDPMVLALSSELSQKREPRRLSAGFTRATSGVLLIQLPIWMGIFAFDEWILALLGPDYYGGKNALFILSSCWLFNGVVGLHGMVLLGYGRSDLMLRSVILTIALQAGLLWLLVPHLGIDGAAIAVACSYVAQNLVQIYEARAIAQTSLYERSFKGPALAAVIGLATLMCAWFALSSQAEVVRRIVSFALALAALAAGYYALVRRAEPASDA